MDSHRVVVVADQEETLVGRQLVVGYQVVNVDDSVFPRKVIRARV